MDIVNLQKKLQVDLAVYRKFIKTAARAATGGDKAHLSVAFIDDARMRQLNQSFRGKGSTTDVLSFPFGPDQFNVQPPATAGGSDFLGDIVISAEQAQKQADENGLTLEDEIKQLILHGLLHLCGFDHETDNGEMNARELELRDKLGI